MGVRPKVRASLASSKGHTGQECLCPFKACNSYNFFGIGAVFKTAGGGSV